MNEKKLLFGTAGIPESASGRSSIEGIKRLREIGLDAMELEFVRGTFPGDEKACEIAETSRKHEIVLTAHGPYYINLSSKDPVKTRASIERVLKTARVAKLCGAKSITFHPGYYMDRPPEQVYNEIKKSLKTVIHKLCEENNTVTVSPEITGKPSQFGSLDEILKLCNELHGLKPCIDFSHQSARTGEAISFENIVSILDKIKHKLGAESLEFLHIHFSGIESGKKGEKRHKNLSETDMDYKSFLQALKDRKVKGVLICESPNLEKDALLLKETYYDL